jgi:energy-converting hydrogenase Eha subunit C
VVLVVAVAELQVAAQAAMDPVAQFIYTINFIKRVN